MQKMRLALLFLAFAVTALPAAAQELTAAEVRAFSQGSDHLRLPSRRQLPHSIFVFRRPERPGFQGALE